MKIEFQKEEVMYMLGLLERVDIRGTREAQSLLFINNKFKEALNKPEEKKKKK